MVHYFYDSEQKEDQLKWYIDCEWNNNLDFETNPRDLDICTITLNNVNDFWTGIVTRKDLDNFVNPNAATNKLNQVVTKALQGEIDFEGQELSWKISQEKNKCEMSLIGYMTGSLPYQLGSIKVSKVTSSSKKQKVMKNWMDNTIKQYFTDKQTRNALSKRNKDLELYRKKMEKELEDLTQEKVESDMITIEKMKQLINSKKRRLHKVIVERDQLLKQVEVQQQALDDKNNTNKEGKQSVPSSSSSSLPQTVPRKRGRPPSSSVGKNEDTHAKRSRTKSALSTQKLQKQPEEEEKEKEEGEENNKDEDKTKNNKHYNLRQQNSIQSSGDETDDAEESTIASKSSNAKNTTTGTTKVKAKDITSPRDDTDSDIDDDDDDDDSDDVFGGVVPKLRRRINAGQSSKSKGKRFARNASDESDSD